MNDDARSLDDEIVSAVLDGEATADEQRRVASDPVLAQRLDEFRQISGAVAEPVDPLDELTRRRLVDRALEQADSPAVVPAAQRRTRPRFGLGGAAAVAGAAVVALLALAGGNVLLEGMGGDDDGDAASAPATDEAELYTADDADGSGGMALDAGDAILEEAAGAEVVWIGTHGTEDAFVEAARQVADAVATAPDVSTTTSFSDISGEAYAPRLAASCPDEVVDEATARAGGAVRLVRGELDGRMVLGVVSIDEPSGPVVLLDLGACTVATFD